MTTSFCQATSTMQQDTNMTRSRRSVSPPAPDQIEDWEQETGIEIPQDVNFLFHPILNSKHNHTTN